MKTLAWYSIIVIAISLIGCLIQALQGYDIPTNIWGIALYVPIVIFVVKYLRKDK
jgi:putative effector of murein hydrolase LrgA (UPF0299 family)